MVSASTLAVLAFLAVTLVATLAAILADTLLATLAAILADTLVVLEFWFVGVDRSA